MNENRHIPFLQKKPVFLLILAIVATTLLSWFNLNSILIILLLVWRLAYGGRPLAAIRTAFTNRFFLAYFSLFAIEVLGMLYTHDIYTAYKHVESKATLVAIPFVFCAGEPIDRKGFLQLLRGYCLLLAGICGFCLAVAVWQYRQTGDAGLFFYHALTEVIGVNAVFFSGYVFVAQLYLLSPEGKGKLRMALTIFFTVMMVLLASKLMLILQAIVFLVYLRGWSRVKLKTSQFVGLALLVIGGTGTLAVTRNPVGDRYQDIMHDDLRYAGKHHVPLHAVFNGVSLRLLIWQFAEEILNERRAWAIGVTSGDSQDLLNRKYLTANMSRGFLSYNFHNQYIEVLVRSGVAGFCIFLAAIALLVELARRTGTKEGWFILAMQLLLMSTESTLEMQHSLFLFCFFPLLFRYEVQRAPILFSDFWRGSWSRPEVHGS
jgi:O-antigen ligase